MGLMWVAFIAFGYWNNQSCIKLSFLFMTRYVPAVVAVGQYFSRRLSFATGLRKVIKQNIISKYFTLPRPLCDRVWGWNFCLRSHRLRSRRVGWMARLQQGLVKLSISLSLQVQTSVPCSSQNISLMLGPPGDGRHLQSWLPLWPGSCSQGKETIEVVAGFETFLNSLCT